MNKINFESSEKYYFLVLFMLLLSCRNTLEPAANSTIRTAPASNNDIANAEFDFLPKSTSNQIVEHEFYTLSYNETFEQADWVAYFLDGRKSQNRFERPFFEQDPLVKTGSADWKNYKKSGYDKGHLCPAGDMKFSETAFNDTFFTSNISPQRHDFNEGIWNRLEQKTRYCAIKHKGIYIVTAGVLDRNLDAIGHEDVAVPKCFYKILFRKSDQKMIGFLVPHKDSDRPLYDFVVSVNQIEQMTGLDFFPKLDDSIEEKMEANSDWKAW